MIEIMNTAWAEKFAPNDCPDPNTDGSHLQFNQKRSTYSEDVLVFSCAIFGH